MNHGALWYQPLYRETALVILAFLFVISGALFFLRTKSLRMTAAWASLKSWIFITPLLLGVMGLKWPYPLVFLVFLAIFGAKTFFRMVGMYHRSWFVWTTYLFIFTQGFCVYYQNFELYNLMPMIFLGIIAGIPLLRNSYRHMIQYVALTLLSFIFFGWGFLYMGHLLTLDYGIYIAIYLYILVEFSETVSISATKLYGKIKMFDNITTRVSVEGVFTSLLLTLIMAWGLRHLLPDRSEKYWVAAALVAFFFGRSGDLILSVIRRDLGIKETGVFIIGRDDILARIDKLLFAAPIFYYVYQLLPAVKI